jgi:cell division protein FtsI/penicillin-binding protein 2
MRRHTALARVLAVASMLLLAAGIWTARRGWRLRHDEPAAPASSALALVQAAAAHGESQRPAVDPMAGLNLSLITSDAAGPEAPTGAGTARLTLDPELQRTAIGLMSAHHLPEAAAILMDSATGRLLVYASHVDKGPARDLCVEATAPSASVFKIVTAAALIEDAHLPPDTKQCYSGGESRINSVDLIEDPQRDRWCTTLAGAMGRSINTVFARLASEHLGPPQLDAMARRFGYGQGVPFDVPVQPSAIHVPTEPLEFARTAAGFWNSTLSPMQAVEMSAIVARGGEAIRPGIVDKVVSSSGALLWSAPEEPVTRRALARETADQITVMMEQTIREGTCWRAFHDPHGTAFLPGIEVAGKTGTLTDAETHRYYTWFTGFAPARPLPPARQVAVAALVVNGPTWQVKANVIARELLRAYFAAQGSEGVTRPSLAAVAIRPAHHPAR